MVRENIIGWMKRQSVAISFILGLITAATIGYTVVNIKDTSDDNEQAIAFINSRWKVGVDSSIKDQAKEIADLRVTIQQYIGAVDKLSQRYNDRLAYCRGFEGVGR